MPWREADLVKTPSQYADLLTDAGCAVDAWETTYVHQLTGETPVLDWITGTALTQVKSRLSPDEWQRYREAIIPVLAQAYPVRKDGTTFFPFRRIFVVAQVGG
jgi:trans-aconitate 2-methyltransferase